VIDRDGNKNSIYNGSENYSLIDDLSIGQNRIRVQVGLTNDKISDFSSSIFITIEENESNNSIQNLAYPAVIILILIILVTSVIYRNRWSE
jgi:ABC-type phosphate transport system permease subunit